jgi:hypothetical protein
VAGAYSRWQGRWLSRKRLSQWHESRRLLAFVGRTAAERRRSPAGVARTQDPALFFGGTTPANPAKKKIPLSPVMI